MALHTEGRTLTLGDHSLLLGGVVELLLHSACLNVKDHIFARLGHVCMSVYNERLLSFALPECDSATEGTEQL